MNMNRIIKIFLILTLTFLLGIPVFAGAQGSLQTWLFIGNQASSNANLIQYSSLTVNQAPAFDRRGTTSAAPFLSSLLIPGWGQYKQGRINRALIFFGFEAAMWGGIFATRAYGKSLESDYKTYAEIHAGIIPNGKDHDYYVNIGNYDSMSEFNEMQQLERDYESLYFGDNNDWKWDSGGNRSTFENLRIQSDKYKHDAVYFAGAIVINHLISAIEAARYNRLSENLKAGVEFSPQGTGMLTIIKGF